ncbi:flotillin-2 [Halyomorpha halys]|uniref:flotillin-2 n=1 Tax=Halyomorpha halys TaxID=286706 RepID=UPI0006D4DBB7|nr:flotillin-2-like [Halyomorpha halys]
MGNLHVVGPNEAVIVSGGTMRKRKKKIVVGGWVWAWSGVTNVQKLSLNLMTLIPKCEAVETVHGVPLTVSGVAQCKFMNNQKFLEIAAEQFLGKSIQQINATIRMTLEGHLRSILGTLTVEEVYKDREKFAVLVREVAAPDVGKMGIQILSFTIRDVYDNVQYLSSLGKAQTAIVKKNADIGVAEAERDAGVKESTCKRLSMDVQYEMYSKIENNSRKYELKKAEYSQEVKRAQAEARLAYELQATKIRQRIRNEEIEINVVERRKQIEIEEQEVVRKELELNGTVRLPAEAESYRLQTIARGQMTQEIEIAIAEREKKTKIGLAEAEVIGKVGKAEANMMLLRANVFKQYGQAAMTSQVLESLPKLAAEVSAPLAKTEDIVMLGGSDHVTGEVNRLAGQIPASLNALTGFDLRKFFRPSSKEKETEQT